MLATPSLPCENRHMRILSLLLLAWQLQATPGSVQQSISQLGQTGNYVLAFRWLGDSVTGAVPNTNAQLQGCCQGYLYSQVEIVPGNPAPTSGYSVQVTTGNGTDILNGAGLAIGSSSPVSLATSPSAPPIDGTFTLVITGQAVASAKGSVFVYLQKPNTVNLAAIRNGNGSLYRPNRAGTVLVYPPPVQNGIAVVIAPNGRFVSTSGTTTSGLQEAENFRYSGGYDMHIIGGDELGGCSPGPSCGPVVYNASTTLAFHPMQGNVIDSGAITINCTGAVGANPCIQFDSLEIVTIKFPGSQVVTAGTGPALLFKPVNAVPQDSLFTGMFCDFYLWAAVNVHSPTSDTVNVPLIDFNMDVAPITYSTFTFIEVNGSGIGIRVKDPMSTNAFVANRVTGNFVHSQFGGSNPIVQIGQTALGGAKIVNNFWNLFTSQAGGNNTGPAISTYESYGVGDIQNNDGAVSYGIFFQTGALGNLFRTGQLGGSNFPVAGYNLSVGGDCAHNGITAESTLGPYAQTLTPGSSPWAFQNLTCQEVDFQVSGGTVSDISTSTTGINVLTTGVTSGVFHVKRGAYIHTTYSVAPTFRIIL